MRDSDEQVGSLFSYVTLMRGYGRTIRCGRSEASSMPRWSG